MVNPRENEVDFELAKNDDEEFLYILYQYEIRFSTSKPKKKFILRTRSPLRLELLADKEIKTLLQEWINKSFETPYKVKKVFSVEYL